ncbi:hypothetical protein OIE66_22455 [Nonomuraea sp. NBC_01738]|uniref:hypothetical protein n=1 Tax=Nonomuraea sp. NBC_01738 TaxID=2976003 RepID=UPI002E11EC49|nr:hypothetical protein OIE66_22455 [Nonomuraea sp. NBC_01738]
MDLLESLLTGLPGEAVRVDLDTRQAHARDSAPFCEAGLPTAVVSPRTVEQVQHVMRTAHRLGVAVVPQGRAPGWPGPPTRSRAAWSCR